MKLLTLNSALIATSMSMTCFGQPSISERCAGLFDVDSERERCIEAAYRFSPATDTDLVRATRRLLAGHEEPEVAVAPPENAKKPTPLRSRPAAKPMHAREFLCAGFWTCDSSVDELSSEKVKWAELRSAKSVSVGSALRETKVHARLTVRLRRDDGLAILISLPNAHIPCALDGCAIRARFDEGAVDTLRIVTAGTGVHDIVFVRSPHNFLARLQKAKLLRLEIPVYAKDAAVLTFQLPGLKLSD